LGGTYEFNQGLDEEVYKAIDDFYGDQLVVEGLILRQFFLLWSFARMLKILALPQWYTMPLIPYVKVRFRHKLSIFFNVWNITIDMYEMSTNFSSILSKFLNISKTYITP